MSHVVYDAVHGALTLRQITSGGFQSGAQAQARFTSGGVTPQEIHGRAADPRFVFTSYDLSGIVGGVSPSAGLAITSGINVPFQKASNQATFVSGSSHFASACTNGLLICESISADQDGDGISAQLTTHCLSATGADPVTPSTGNALASTAFNAEYDLGPCVITPDGGSAITLDIAGFTVNTGITVVKRRLGGYKFPTYAFIRRVAPTIDLRFFDFDTLATLLASYKKISALACYGMKKSDGATHVAGASTVHLKFSFAAGISQTESFEASETNDGMATLRVHGKALSWSSSNALP